MLGFLLGTAVAMAVAGALSSLLSLLAWPLAARLGAARRADAALAALLAPVSAALTVGLAVSLPSLRHALGFGADHCAEHLHHAHLCWLHASGLPPLLAALGASAIAAFVWRAFRPLTSAWRAARVSVSLERVSEPREDLVWVPGSARICHTVGVFSPKIYLSRSLAGSLAEDHLAVVLAHERAHVARNDPAFGLVTSLACAFGLPIVADGWRAAWRQAAEEAADAEAARAHGPLAVASALVAFARLQQAPELLPGIGFGPVGLEARVLRLLGARHSGASRTFALPLLALALSGAVILAAARSDTLHHQVEDVAHVLSR